MERKFNKLILYFSPRELKMRDGEERRGKERDMARGK